MLDTLNTKDLLRLLIDHLTSLGFPSVAAEMRWEGDGVYEVGPPPRDPDGRHWYLWANGTDAVDYFPAGVSLVLIEPGGGEDPVVAVSDLAEIGVFLTQHGHLPVR